MNRATPQMRAFANRLIERETSRKTIPDSKTYPAAFPISDKLRSKLTMLIGSGGFRALFARSLALGSAELPWLRAVQVKVDGALDGFNVRPQPTQEELIEGREVLLAHLLGLMVTFIGPALTVQVVRETWPKIFLGDLDLGNGNKNETTN